MYYLSVNYVLIIDLINSNEIKDENNDEVIKEHDNVLIGVNKVTLILSIFDLNFVSKNTKEFNAFIQPK
jgi:hypothetical protein